jgi:uncharacterized lipoprotein YmbA
MSRHPHNPLRAVARCAALGLLVIAGCNVVPPAQEDATRYFVLSDTGLPPPAGGGAAAAGTLRVGLHTVRLEGYLKGRQMIVRNGANEVRFEDYRRWAEPLDAAVTRIVRSRLLAGSAVAQVYAEPFPFDQARDYDVSIEVTRFEGAEDASGKFVASLSATIEISTAGADSRVVSRRSFDAPVQGWDGADFDRLAQLLNTDVAALAQEVASELPAKP